VAFAPANVPPVAVQEVALVELQVSVDVPPLAIVDGFAVSVAVGRGATVTVAVAAVLVAPVPVHVREYVVFAVSPPVDWLPLVAFAPANVPPVAVHEVALVELQVSVDVPPLSTVVGDAVSDTVAGAGLLTTGTDPDPPQAARSSAAPKVITWAVKRIRVLWKGRIMSAASPWLNPVRAEATTAGPLAHSCAASSVIPSLGTLTYPQANSR
jgi:hypothetical protein